MKKKVVLLGLLGEKFGETHFLSVKSVGETVRALAANFPGFEKFIARSTEDNVGYHVFIGGKDTEKDEELLYPLGKTDNITISPVIAGSAATARVVFGALLIAAGAIAFFGATTATGGAGAGAGAVIGKGLITLGIGLVLGGVVQLLSPVPKAEVPKENEANRPSYFFNGPVNTTAQGQPIPLLYGEGIIGGAIVSAGISVEDIAL